MRYLQEEKDDKKTKPTLFRSIIRQFNEALKETQDDHWQAIGTGYKRSVQVRIGHGKFSLINIQ